MTPIQDLLHRIRWDPEFGNGRFTIGFYDRVEDRILVIPLKEISRETGDRYGFDLVDQDGVTHSVPLHRIKEVYKDEVLIWHRER